MCNRNTYMDSDEQVKMMIDEPYTATLDAAMSGLLVAQRGLAREISRYPVPISGCDAQFNQLLSDRRRISRAIQALKDAPFIPTPRVLEEGGVSESR